MKPACWDVAFRHMTGARWECAGHWFCPPAAIAQAATSNSTKLSHGTVSRTAKEQLKSSLWLIHGYLVLFFFMGVALLVWEVSSLKLLWFQRSFQGKLGACALARLWRTTACQIDLEVWLLDGLLFLVFHARRQNRAPCEQTVEWRFALKRTAHVSDCFAHLNYTDLKSSWTVLNDSEHVGSVTLCLRVKLLRSLRWLAASQP